MAKSIRAFVSASDGAAPSRAAVGPHARLLQCCVLVVALVVVIVLAGAFPVMRAVPRVGVAPAEAAGAGEPIQGLVRVREASEVDSAAFKTVRARCPQDKVVLGGGARIRWNSISPDNARLVLRRLWPATTNIPDGVFHDAYIVEAAELAPGVANDWWVEAYALCAYEPSGYHRVTSPVPSQIDSSAVDAEVARCPAGQRALGSGASISVWEAPPTYPEEGEHAQIGLQVARASGTGDITRAQAHEDANGFNGYWNVRAHAVCADAPDGYEVRYGESPDSGSESPKYAIAECTDERELIGAGAAISNVAPGHVTLQEILAYDAPEWVRAKAIENTPTNQSWDFIVAQAICATTWGGVD